MLFLAHWIMDLGIPLRGVSPMGGALAILNSEGSRRPRHRGVLFLGYFFLDKQKEVTRAQLRSAEHLM